MTKAKRLNANWTNWISFRKIGLLMLFIQWFVIAAPVHAEILTLEQALELSLQQNRELENAGLEIDKATENIEAERTKRLPKLNFDLSESYNLTPQTFTYKAGTFGTVPTQDVEITAQDGFTTIVSAGAKQPLAQLYKIGLSIDQLEVMKEIAGQHLRASRQKIIKKVKTAYYDILKTQLSLQASNERIIFYRELALLVDRQFAQQTVLSYQPLEVKSRLARSEHEAKREQNILATQQEELNLLLGRNVLTRFEVSSVAASHAELPAKSEVESLALSQRPEIQETELKLEHAKYGYRIKQSEYFPDIDLEVRYTRLFGTEFIPDEESSVGLRLYWEFYDWGRKSDDLSKKQYTIRQTRNEIKETKARILIEVNDRLRQLENARDLDVVTKLTQTAAREKVRVLMNQYRQQAVLLDDLLRAEADLADANSEYHHALLSVWSAQAELEKAMGEG